MIMYPVTKYNASAMLSNIHILGLAYIKLSIKNLNIRYNNSEDN